MFRYSRFEGDYSAAINYFQRALDCEPTKDSKVIKSNSDKKQLIFDIASIYSKLNNYSKAYDYSKMYVNQCLHQVCDEELLGTMKTLVSLLDKKISVQKQRDQILNKNPHLANEFSKINSSKLDVPRATTKIAAEKPNKKQNSSLTSKDKSVISQVENLAQIDAAIDKELSFMFDKMIAKNILQY